MYKGNRYQTPWALNCPLLDPLVLNFFTGTLFLLQSNSSQTPGHFDRGVVGQQIKDMAIFETVDLIQGGMGTKG